MVRFEDLQLFVRTAALGSFSNVAREVGLLPGQVAAAVKRLERDVDVRLFARSTRSLRLTAEGEQYLPFAREVLETLQEGQDRVRRESTQLQGVLQISAPSDLGRNLLLPWISEFRSQHPALNLRLLISDQVADVFRDPVDVALRYGVFDDASYVALPLAPWNHRVLVAAPAYLARNGRPEVPADLRRHACLLYPLNGRVYDRWRLGKQTVEVAGALFSSDAEIVRRWAVAGEGVAYKSWLDVHDDIEMGRLEVLLPGYATEPTPLNLVCPHRKQYSPAVQALHGMLRSRLDTLQARFPTMPA
ncbi:LysR family transcriptional regulator [Pseudomonas japonica]|uniref:LysR family transcriptional regulator n=1 Tax=Pseudomonas japonica TaxID=256466 RepID=UPI0015E2ABF4|nr:LysR family transcriptional regulator [Pseudomonas japonica]MBA1242769.1 LysR family transcriptional regulator [Pseudomonas japonica]MBA1290636.1 LysR family transcriptional regulator [Pseudomonas japonica]